VVCTEAQTVVALFQRLRQDGDLDALGDLHDEVFGHDDVGGVAALGQLAVFADGARRECFP
jgi:hypothetical protein